MRPPPYRDRRNGPPPGWVVTHAEAGNRRRPGIRNGDLRLLQVLSDAIPGLMAYLDAAGRVRYCNATFETWFGIAPARLLGRTFEEALKDAVPVRQADLLQRALLGERNHDQIEVGALGERRWLHAAYVPHLDAKGKVIGVFTMATDITPIKRSELQLMELARYDALTGLGNRRTFEAHLESAIQRANDSDRPLALLYIDIDRFKHFNDRYGHAAGDEILQEVATRMTGAVRTVDLVARLAGDEFVIVLENLAGRHDADAVAQSLLRSLQVPIIHRNLHLAVGISIGVAFHAPPLGTAKGLVEAADQALYAAKAAGGNGSRHHQAQALADPPASGNGGGRQLP